MKKIILIKGAGDLASAVAIRLHRAGYKIVMTDIAVPTAVRRTVSFNKIIYDSECIIEGIESKLAKNIQDIYKITDENKIAVIVDENAEIRKLLRPEVLVDCIIAKKNINTKIDDADLVIGVGPGFTPKLDCDCCVETKRGHFLGRVFWNKTCEPNTGIPGNIGGYSTERIIRATDHGKFIPKMKIGDMVEAGALVAYVKTIDGDMVPVNSKISGVIRGLLQEGVSVHKGMKSGDVDPRNKPEYCNFVSDKGLAIAGGVLEAICGHKKEEI